jgi:hypothetical protein
MLHKHATPLIFGIKYERTMAETAGHPFFQKVLPKRNEPP